MRVAVAVCVLCPLLGCGGRSPPAAGTGLAPPTPAAELPEDEAAALLAGVLQAYLKDSKDGDGTYIWVRGRDPSAGLLRRLQGRWPKLRPGSGMPAGGCRLDFTDVRRLAADRATVRVERNCRGGAGTWEVNRLALNRGGWEVVEVESQIAD